MENLKILQNISTILDKIFSKKRKSNQIAEEQKTLYPLLLKF